MIKPRTVGIVGMGHVGAHVANSLLLQGLADELYLCDIDSVNCQDRYEELAGCDVIVNAAGKVSLAAGNRVGELGASMLAAWKSASISGKPLAQLADEEPERFAFDLAELEDKARQGGYVTFASKP